MPKMTIALALISMLAMVINGCAIFGPDRKVRSETMQPQPTQGSEEKTFDDLLVEIGKRVPAFGGMFVDTDGKLAIYLLDTTQGAAAEVAIAAVFGRERIPPGGIRVLQGQYSFLQLRDWYDGMGAVLGVSGVTVTDIDEGRNRLLVGLVHMDKRGLVEQELGKLGIPLEAVVIEETGPIIPLKGGGQ
jgi:hypothetical protein